jgi:hypothetical protein
MSISKKEKAKSMLRTICMLLGITGGLIFEKILSDGHINSSYKDIIFVFIATVLIQGFVLMIRHYRKLPTNLNGVFNISMLFNFGWLIGYKISIIIEGIL